MPTPSPVKGGKLPKAIRPWTAQLSTPVYHSGEHRIIISVNGGERPVAIAVGETLQEAQANARLIAASQEILEALKLIKSDYEDLARNHADAWYDYEVLSHSKINNIAKTAINQALGLGGEATQ